eukprot:NODE_748_length_4589_cov_0.257238.p2 type:complete len:364 gc:universal NODE_748_length_4589_cov_0.257238:2614-1523(-)
MKQLHQQILLLVFLWYFSSIGLTFLNRKLALKYSVPLYITSFHMFIHSVLAHLITKRKPTWPKKNVFPTAITTAGDIGASNMSLQFVNVGFYTIVKSSVPLFVLFFAILFGLEKMNFKLCMVILVITVGLTLSVWQNSDFNGIGFILLLLAVSFSGLRWSLTQILMADMKSPLHAMRDLSPVMSLCTLIAALIANPINNIYFGAEFSILYFSILVIFGSLLAFVLTLSEFRLLQISSVMTVAIFGIIKEILTIVLDSFIEEHKKPLSLINGFGLVLCISGIICYHIYRKTMKNVEIESYSPVTEIFFLDDLEENNRSPKKRNSYQYEEQTSPILSQPFILNNVREAIPIYDCEDIEMNDISSL